MNKADLEILKLLPITDEQRAELIRIVNTPDECGIETKTEEYNARQQRRNDAGGINLINTVEYQSGDIGNERKTEVVHGECLGNTESSL